MDKYDKFDLITSCIPNMKPFPFERNYTVIATTTSTNKDIAICAKKNRRQKRLKDKRMHEQMENANENIIYQQNLHAKSKYR